MCDCGYESAIHALLEVSEGKIMQTQSSATKLSKNFGKLAATREVDGQKTIQPTAVKIPRCTRSIVKNLDEIDAMESECSSSSSSSSSPNCTRKRKRSAQQQHPHHSSSEGSSSEKKTKYVRLKDRKDEQVFASHYVDDDERWSEMCIREKNSPFRVVANYPDDRNFMPPGARRKAVNVMCLMSHVLNLELCTPGLGSLIMDRFFSCRESLPFPNENSIMVIAMICLNIAGKMADLDRGTCGSKRVMSMLREASPDILKQDNHDDFAKYATKMECEIMNTLDGNILSCPCVMQIISQFTRWDTTHERLWYRAAFMCDVFNIDSVSTYFLQTEIARGIVDIIHKTSTHHVVTESIVRSLHVFFNSAGIYEEKSDPYFGVRLRHLDNSEVRNVRRELFEIVKIS
jgi:hypothetical protein